MIAIVVVAAVFVILLIAFLWFYFYSRTPAWGDSETRKAVLRVLVVVGPIFGMHYREPRPEPTTISTPKLPDDDATIGISLPAPPEKEP